MPATQIRETLDDTSRLRLSNRILLVGLTVALVLGAAVLTAQFAARQVEDTAVNEGAQSARVDRSLDRRPAADEPARWTVRRHPTPARHRRDARRRSSTTSTCCGSRSGRKDGTVLFSDLPALRGQQFDVDEDLGEAFDGNGRRRACPSGTSAENVFETGLADRFLEVYVPVRSTTTGQVVAAYEIYQNAKFIDDSIATTRLQVFLIAGVIAAILAVLLLRRLRGDLTPARAPEPPTARPHRHARRQ